MYYCPVANQQQQLSDWCSRQLPTTAVAAAAADAEPCTADDEHQTVGASLLAGHDHTSAAEVFVAVCLSVCLSVCGSVY